MSNGIEERRFQSLTSLNRLCLAGSIECFSQLFVETSNLDSASFGLFGAPLCAGRKLTDREGGNKKCGQRDPILGVCNRESVKRRQKEKVEALDAGADDYVTKPFGMDELLARIRATLRRKPATDSNERILQAGDFRVDLDAHLAMHGENELRLTPKEFELLVHLVRNPGKVLTHRALLGAVWGGDYTEQHEYLRVFIGQLQKKIESDPSKQRYFLTEPWIGYRFNPD